MSSVRYCPFICTTRETEASRHPTWMAPRLHSRLETLEFKRSIRLRHILCLLNPESGPLSEILKLDSWKNGLWNRSNGGPSDQPCPHGDGWAASNPTLLCRHHTRICRLPFQVSFTSSVIQFNFNSLYFCPLSDPSEQLARVCYVRFLDPTSVLVAQHLTNTVFIDRAIFVKPVLDSKWL